VKALFVDTGGWVMLVDTRDPRHQAARRARDRMLEDKGVLVSTDYVVDETLTLLRMRMGLDVARRWWEWVEQSPRVRWEAIDSDRAERARRWFFDWEDKDFSFTDCSSFVVMKELKLRSALTPDKHFALAGFQIAPG
jgi:predicted nucleic acid-binding protein